MRRLLTMTLLIAHCSLLTVCDLWMRPMGEFIKDATSEAQGIDYYFATNNTITEAKPRAMSSGEVPIPVGEETEIRVLFRNPQNYELDLKLFDNINEAIIYDPDPDSLTYSIGGKVEIEETDRQTALVTITNPVRGEIFDLSVTGFFAQGRPIRTPYNLPKMKGCYFNTDLVINSVHFFVPDYTSIPADCNEDDDSTYTADISSETDYIIINVSVRDDLGSSFEISDSEPVSGGYKVFTSNKDKVTITVTAESGVTKTYTLNLNKLGLELHAPDPVAEPTAVIYGYTTAPYVDIPIYNNGNNTVIGVTVSHNNTTDFTLSDFTSGEVASGDTKNIRVTLNLNKNAKDDPYTTTVTVTYTGATGTVTNTFTVKFKVNKRTLTITSPSASPKIYDGDKTYPSGDVTIGNITNKVGTDDVTVSVLNAEYNYATVVQANKLTVSYSISGSSAGNYNAPENSEISLSITKKQLTWNAGVVQDRQYNGTTNATITTQPTLNGVITADNTNVTVTQGTVSFTSVDAGTSTLIASGWGIDGSAAGNYNAPDSQPTFTGSITKADGATVAAPTLASKTHNSITINAVSVPSTGQSVEYAISTSNSAPADGWQSTLTFSDLLPSTMYYIFARSASNTNYNAGTPSAALEERTSAGGAFNIVFPEITGSEPEPEVTVSGDISRSGKNGPMSMTISAPEGYDEYIWRYNGTGPDPLPSEREVTLYGYYYAVPNGVFAVHSYSLIVRKGSGATAEWYSVTVKFTVVP